MNLRSPDAGLEQKELEIKVAESKPLLQDRLRSAFRSELVLPADLERHLAAALKDTLARTGNLVRAELSYHMARSYDLPEEAAFHPAIAMEYFHTSSLLFDDLPSMDDASHRRGAECVHVLHGESATILTALSLINRAYALLWSALAYGAASSRDQAAAYVERYLGVGGLLNGQSHDLHYSKLAIAERSPQQVAMGKTVALIRLSLVLPAMVGGASARSIRLLDRLAVVWGLAYQAIDDLKDVLHDAERAGKTTARDSLLDRPNLALTLGPAATIKRLHKLVRLGQRLTSEVQTTDSVLGCLNPPTQRLRREVAALEEEVMEADR